MKKNTWLKILLAIIFLEIFIGGVFFAFKKIKANPDNGISLKDKTVQALYKKISHEDIELLDVMSNDAILYYAYWNLEKKETINCEVVKIEEDTKDYTCEGIAPFVKKSDLLEAVKDLYGPSVSVDITSFAIDQEHYGYYDEENKGVVVYERKSNTAPINIKLVKAVKKDDKIELTTEVLDGIYGTVLHTYKYTFEKNKQAYYLIKKEKVKE